MLSHPTSRLGRIGAIVAFTLVAAAVIPAAPALAATGEACPNEAVRAESNINPLTGQPYDVGLPECRAYEMVSPLEKQQHDALSIVSPPRISVSPEGGAIEWTSQGAYAGAENYQILTEPSNPYVAQRTASGWVTRSGYPPMNLIEDPSIAFGQGAGVYSSNLADESVCGGATSTGNGIGPTIRCALRDPTGVWTGTPEYTDLTGETTSFETVGASSVGKDVVFNVGDGVPFLSSDTSSATEGCNGVFCGGLYEEAGVGSASPELRLVNVDNNGNMIGPNNGHELGAPFFEEPKGSDYQAVSADGAKIFFTATPNGGVPTIYARIDGKETVAISNPSPSECTRCTQEAEEGKPENSEPRRAVYQGASADGSKVFFTTYQQLVNSDTDEENDLYEYSFNNPPAHRIVQVSGGGLGDATPGAGAGVGGVVTVSEDGSHVYFIAGGVLTTLPNGLGQTATKNTDNLYAYDANTGETKFVATLLGEDEQLWGFTQPVAGTNSNVDLRRGETTPDGRYLVFDSFAELITAGPEADTSGAQQVYRYDFQTGKLIRVSVGHEGFANNGNTPGFNALIGPADDASEAASPAVNDANRSISENGETIAFVSAAQLQSTDIVSGANKLCNAEGAGTDDDGAGCQVYVWHDGAVNMISDGQDPNGAVYAGMSGTGSDIFFQIRTQLVGQDTDRLGDIYDARIDGGFSAPAPQPSCAGEACQGTPSAAPVFFAPGTASFSGGVNDVAPPSKKAVEPETKPKSKPLTKAQKLKATLKACKKIKAKSKRQACEARARKQYGPKPKAQAKKR